MRHLWKVVKVAFVIVSIISIAVNMVVLPKLVIPGAITQPAGYMVGEFNSKKDSLPVFAFRSMTQNGWKETLHACGALKQDRRSHFNTLVMTNRLGWALAEKVEFVPESVDQASR